MKVCLTPGTFLLSLFLSAQWDAINEMDEYFTPIHTYQVRIGLHRQTQTKASWFYANLDLITLIVDRSSHAIPSMFGV